jgi:hypothetical protein
MEILSLKQDLENIVKKKLLSKKSPFICSNLKPYNKDDFQKYREMSQNYASEYIMSGYSWWRFHFINDDKDKKHKYVLKEKYRFINDLINIL